MREERVNDQARSHKEVDRRTFTFEARDVLDRQHRRGPVGRFARRPFRPRVKVVLKRKLCGFPERPS